MTDRCQMVGYVIKSGVVIYTEETLKTQVPLFFSPLFSFFFGLMLSPSARKLTFWFPVARQLATATGRVARLQQTR